MTEDNFVFDLEAKRTRITNEQMIDSLNKFYTICGKPFTTKEYDNWIDRKCTSQAISRRFESWRKALSEIGIQHGVQAYAYTELELMENLEIVWRQLGFPPGKRQLKKFGYRISERPYINRWGSVAKACVRLKLFKEGKIDESQLLPDEQVRKRDSVPVKLRWTVLQRDFFRCVKCGKRPPEVRLEIDHVQPWSHGGNENVSNLQTLCNICNAGKSDSIE